MDVRDGYTMLADCILFMQGRCKDPHCSFRHYIGHTDRFCWDFEESRGSYCPRGEDCHHRHAITRLVPCFMVQHSRCSYAASQCFYEHPTITRESRGRQRPRNDKGRRKDIYDSDPLGVDEYFVARQKARHRHSPGPSYPEQHSTPRDAFMDRDNRQRDRFHHTQCRKEKGPSDPRTHRAYYEDEIDNDIYALFHPRTSGVKIRHREYYHSSPEQPLSDRSDAAKSSQTTQSYSTPHVDSKGNSPKRDTAKSYNHRERDSDSRPKTKTTIRHNEDHETGSMLQMKMPSKHGPTETNLQSSGPNQKKPPASKTDCNKPKSRSQTSTDCRLPNNEASGDLLNMSEVRPEAIVNPSRSKPSYNRSALSEIDDMDVYSGYISGWRK
ncbi:hypothetical protein DFH27DRAFT_570087 [Peziza echinospora]|nr:hypothetical protein DFH27DRAFT_570087 [Peziza echinospora]